MLRLEKIEGKNVWDTLKLSVEEGYSSDRSVHLLHRPHERADTARIQPVAKRF